MSTDLEFRRGLPQLRLPTIRSIRHSQPSAGGDNSASNQTPKSGSDSDSASDDECHTPTSPDHKIPAILRCPPAPKKPGRRSAPCKRKLCELEFFEMVGREEVESFFRSSSIGDQQLLNLNSSSDADAFKRRCPYPSSCT